MRLLYVTDTKIYKCDGKFYDAVYLEPDELIMIHGDIDEIDMICRIYDTKEVDNMKEVLGQNCSIRFIGATNQMSGVVAHAKSFVKNMRAYKMALARADVVWLKFNMFNSYALGLSIQKRKVKNKVIIGQMVGDIECMIFSAKGRMQKRIYGMIVGACKRLYKRIAAKMDAQIYVSKALETKYRVDNVPSYVIHENRIKKKDIIPEKDIKTRKPEDPLKVLFLGRLVPEKRPMDLLLAAKALQNVTVNYIGKGPSKEDLIAYAEQSELEGRVCFLETRKWGPDLFEKMREYDVLVLPSESEGLPLVLAEAMSNGLPVIATQVGGIAEIVDDGENGLLYPPGDVPSLIACIEAMADSENKRRAFAFAGLKKAHKNSFDVQMEKLREVLRKCFEDRALRLDGLPQGKDEN